MSAWKNHAAGFRSLDPPPPLAASPESRPFRPQNGRRGALVRRLAIGLLGSSPRGARQPLDCFEKSARWLQPAPARLLRSNALVVQAADPIPIALDYD